MIVFTTIDINDASVACDNTLLFCHSRINLYPPCEEGCSMRPTSWIRTLVSRRHQRSNVGIARAVTSTLEPLESRRLYAVTATTAGGVLTVLGDDNPNAIVVSRDVAGNLLVNGGNVPIVGLPRATVANI